MDKQYGFLWVDIGDGALFHGLLQHVDWLGAADFAGVSVVTSQRYFFRLPERPSPDAWALLLAWQVQGDHLTPTRASQANWLLPGIPTRLSTTELCSGLGFMGIGTEWAGFQPGPMVEQSSEVCRLLQAYRQQHVIQADVSDPMLATELLLHTGSRLQLPTMEHVRGWRWTTGPPLQVFQRSHAAHAPRSGHPGERLGLLDG